jgi:Flp pilus assembly protein TadG
MKRLRSESGAAAVEFALVVPVLLVLLLGIIEFGRVYNAQLQLTAAARDAARVVSINAAPAQTLANARSAAIASAGSLNPAVAPSQVAVSVNPGGTSVCPPGSTATVTVTYPLKFLTGVFGASVTLTGRGAMQCGA